MNLGPFTVCTAGLFAALSLCGCSGSDRPIAQDYAIHDLGGSNQILSGAEGMVAIADITAYKLEEPYIYVEVGGRPRLEDPASRSCSYTRVDMRSAEVSSPSGKSAEARLFARKIKDGGQAVMEWTCVWPGGDYHGLLYDWIGK